MNRPAVASTVLIAALGLSLALVACGSADEPAAPGDDPTATSLPTTTSSPPSTPATSEPPAVTELPSVLAASTQGWDTDWSRRSIELDELKIGIQASDPRDLIRPLDDPAYESIESAGEWLVDREIGISMELGDDAFFFPLRILTSHEIVNGEAAGIPFAVTYCPLCNTAVAFDRGVDGDVLRFGVSGLLRNSDLVMWDDATVSLWQQITGEAIVGTMTGTRLELLPTATVRWADFREAHPDGHVLSIDTGFRFNYGANSYVGYSSRSAPFDPFFDAELDDRYPALDRVVGVRVGDATKAYPFAELQDVRTVNDELAGVPITVWWAPTDAADNFDGSLVGQGAAIGTGIAFIRRVGDQTLTFEPAGDDTFTDLETGSTWSLFGEAIDGPLAGSQLELALHQNEFWFAWSTFNRGAPVYAG